jgi:cold shock CspA family protein
MSGYHVGTVDSFNDFGGYGYLEPDDEALGSLVLFHRRSVRHPSAAFRVGDRVTFKIENLARGLLAIDVDFEGGGSLEGPSGEPSEGVVHATKPARNFGFVRLKDGREAFFHASYVREGNGLPPLGTQVVFSLIESARGLQAKDIRINHETASAGPGALVLPAAPPSSTTGSASPAQTTDMYLARATLARDSRDYFSAIEHYERGMAAAPSVQLILSYAAMEKNRNRSDEAMRVYERGIEIYPDLAKLREDAGILAASLKRFDDAIEYLEAALHLCRSTAQGGEKGVLLALGRTLYRANTLSSLKKSLEHYEEARALFENGRLEAHDLHNISIAELRTQHHRGDMAFRYLSQAGFEVERATLLGQRTLGGDLVVRLRNPEFQESYSIGERLLVRCMFKSDLDQSDIKDIAQSLESQSAAALVDEHLALAIVASLSDGLQRTLFQRIDTHQSAIVPLPQDVLERAEDPLATLRRILDQWLYRRDLFAMKAPVVGKSFFGRNRSLADLREAIQIGASTGVFGLRKAGKTSLLKETERRFSETGDIVVYLDLLRVPADQTDTRWLYWKIAQELHARAPRRGLAEFKWRLGGAFEDFLDVPANFPVATAFDTDLTRLLSALHTARLNPAPRIIIMLDEIEKILPNALGRDGFHGYFEFFGYLRGICQERDGFVVIVTGANPAVAEAPQFEGRDNPVFNFFREVYLQLLDRSECMDMIRTLGRGMGIRFSEDAARLVFELTGGHPFFARQLCSFVAKRHPERPLRVERERIERLLDVYVEMNGNDFAEIVDRLDRDYSEELEILLRVVRAGKPIPLGALGTHGVTLRHLEGYQLLTVQNGHASLTMSMLGRYLNSKGLA